MKKYKFLWYLLFVFLIVALFDIIFSFSIEKIMDDRYTPQLHKTKDASSQIAVIGASRASHHYVPSLLEDSLNLKAYNYGIDGRNIFVHYAVLESLLNDSQEKPEIVILDLNKTDIDDMPSWNAERLNILYPYYKSNPYVKLIVDDLLDKKEVIAIKNSGLIRHNSEMINDIKVLISERNNVDTNNGYVPLFSVWNEDIKESGETGDKTNESKIEYLKKFIERCKEENVKLIIAVSPTYINSADTKWISEIKKISEEENVPFIDFHDYGAILSHREWFSDPDHLNDTGAKEYTRYIIKQITDSLHLQ